MSGEPARRVAAAGRSRLGMFVWLAGLAGPSRCHSFRSAAAGSMRAILRAGRPSAAAPVRPATSPIRHIRRPPAATARTTRSGVAPRAVRMAISGVRRMTENETTPAAPAAPRAGAGRTNEVVRNAFRR